MLLSFLSLEGGDDARHFRHGAAAGHGGQGSHLLHSGADQPEVSVWFDVQVNLLKFSQPKIISNLGFRNRIEFCDGTASPGDKVYSRYDEKTAVAWLW